MRLNFKFFIEGSDQIQKQKKTKQIFIMSILFNILKSLRRNLITLFIIFSMFAKFIYTAFSVLISLVINAIALVLNSIYTGIIITFQRSRDLLYNDSFKLNCLSLLFLSILFYRFYTQFSFDIGFLSLVISFLIYFFISYFILDKFTYSENIYIRFIQKFVIYNILIFIVMFLIIYFFILNFKF